MDTPPHRKRPRLTNACNLCRRRKVRCDARQPDCTNCVRAGVQCTTSDPRRPDQPAERQESGRSTSSRSLPIPTASPSESHRPGPARPPEIEDRLPALPRFNAGHGSSALTQWLDIALARLGIPDAFGDLPQSNSVGLSQCLRKLVHDAPLQRHGNGPEALAFEDVSNIYAIFPLPVLLTRHARQLPVDTDDDEAIFDDSLILLRRACTEVQVLGVNCQTSLCQARNAIVFALQHLGIIVCTPSPLAVEALVLLSLQLRACDQTDVAWHVITLATSMAQTIGLQRRCSAAHGALTSTPPTSEEELHCIWWCVYILERMLALESERGSNIKDSDCDLDVPYLASAKGRYDTQPLFCAAVRLAHIQGEVMNSFLQNRAAEENPAVSVEKAVCDKIRSIGQLDAMLQRWTDSMPKGLRPDNYMDCDPALLPGVAHLALQFHITEFLLHRHGLIVHRSAITTVVEHHFAAEPFRHRLLNAHNICAHSTRTMVAILGHLHENGAFSIFDALYPALLAVYGLAVQIISRPTAVTVRSDIEIKGIAVALINRHTDFIHYSGLEDDREVAVRGHVLQRLSDVLSRNADRPLHRTGPELNTPPVPTTPQSQGQSLSRYATDTSTQAYNTGLDVSNTLDNANVISAFTPGLFPDGLSMEEFDWDTFANAFNFG